MRGKGEFRYGKELLLDKNLVVTKRTFINSSGLHSHSFYELELIVSGEGTLDVNGNCYDLRTASVHIANPLDYHELYSENGVEIINISFSLEGKDTELVERIFGNVMIKAISIDPCDLEKCSALASVMIKEQDDGDPDNITEACLNSILKIIARYIPKCDRLNLHVSKAMRFVQTHFKQDLSLSSVAKEIGFSEQYLSSLFHKASGMSFKQYLNILRVTHAKRLIETTNLNLTDICFECGFGSYSGFYRAFEKITGAPPNKYVVS